MRHSTVPVIIDSIKKDEGFPLTRCFYFCIETATPQSGWGLTTDWYRGPILLLGMSAIIVGPPSGAPSFASPDDFNELMKVLDGDEEDFYLEQNAIWLPNISFGDAGHDRGAVFRVGLDAFRHAYAYTEQHMDQELFMEYARSMREDVFFSEEETKAFAAWDQELLEDVRAEYHQNRDEMLRTRDQDQDPEPDPGMTM